MENSRKKSNAGGIYKTIGQIYLYLSLVQSLDTFQVEKVWGYLMLGLFAVGIGSVVNLLFFWILKNYVSDESGIAIRAAINIGSYFSILLCFGYDSASATEQNFEHFRRKIQVLFTFNLLG